MVSAKDIKLGLASAVIGGFMAFAPAQNAEADVNSTNETSSTTQTEMMQAVHTSDSLADFEVTPLAPVNTNLKFKHTPEQIQASVMRGGTPPGVQLSSKPMSFENFVSVYNNMNQARRASVFVGVVVDTSDADWQDGYIRDVHAMTEHLITGDRENGKPGFAETDGASVVGVIPIAYDPTDRARKYVDVNDMSNDEQEFIDVKVNETLIVFNNHVLPRQEDGHFVDNLEDVHDYMRDLFLLGYHRQGMREHDASYQLHVDRAVAQKEVRIANNAWTLEDSGLVLVHAGLNSGRSGGGEGKASDDAAPPTSLASNGL